MSSVSYRHFTGTAAQNYEHYFVPAIAEPVATALLEEAALQPGQRVLDVACGTGVIARRAAEQVGPTGSVAGVDLAPDMIETAAAAPAPTGTSIDWQQGDAADLPHADGAFDVVLCQMGLMFLEDKPAAIAEMRRVLTAGGRLVVNTPGRIQPPFELMEQALIDHIGAELGVFVRVVFSMHDPTAVAALLRDGGFHDVSAREYNATLRLPPPAEFLWQYINLTPMGPFVETATESAKEALEQQVVEQWAPYVENGGTPVNQPMVLASGRR